MYIYTCHGTEHWTRPHMWLLQSFSGFEECTGPPVGGHGGRKFKDGSPMHRPPITNQENGAEKSALETVKLQTAAEGHCKQLASLRGLVVKSEI